ncbi:MAG: hypothetical protein KKG59_06665 [Nanoarchaeota archaeon]|nr:hypothetical protein [Nanoarchaeota archaeon]
MARFKQIRKGDKGRAIFVAPLAPGPESRYFGVEFRLEPESLEDTLSRDSNTAPRHIRFFRPFVAYTDEKILAYDGNIFMVEGPVRNAIDANTQIKNVLKWYIFNMTRGNQSQSRPKRPSSPIGLYEVPQEESTPKEKQSMPREALAPMYEVHTGTEVTNYLSGRMQEYIDDPARRINIERELNAYAGGTEIQEQVAKLLTVVDIKSHGWEQLVQLIPEICGAYREERWEHAAVVRDKIKALDAERKV